MRFRRKIDLPILMFAFCVSLQTASACSCFSNGSVCGSLKGTEIVFVGRVTQDSGEGLGTGPATMVVEEIFHGLPKDLREVTVDTSAGTSCYMRLKKDERYVIYGSGLSGARLKLNICSFSFQVAGNETLLSALRAAEAGIESRLVGKVRMKYEEYNVSGEGAAGVHVVANLGQTKLEATTSANGEFEFLNIAPGQYHLEVSSPNLVEDKSHLPAEDLRVPGGSCGYQSFYVWPDGRIQGTVTGPDGKPLEGVPVQVFAKNKRGEIDMSPLREQRSAAHGSYVLTGLPPGEFVVGVNGAKYEDKFPWPPSFYRGTSDRDTASKLTIGRGQNQTGIDLEVDAPRTRAMLHIETVFEDGSPAFGGANVENLAGIQRAFAIGRDKDKNVLDVPVYIGETYRVKSSKFSSKPREPVEQGRIRMQVTTWKGISGPVQVNGADVHVRVVLVEEKK